MKVKVNRKALVEALKKVKKAVPRYHTIPALKCIMLSAEGSTLHLSATDLELFLTTYIDAEVYQVGNCLIPETTLSYVASMTLDPEIEIELSDNNAVLIKTADDYIKVASLDIENFIDKPTIDEKHTLSIKQSDFKELIRQTTFAIATDNQRPILQGVKMIVEGSKITMVSVDGYRMAVNSGKVESSKDIDCIVAGKVLDKISSTIRNTDDLIHISFHGLNATLKYDSTVAIVKLYEGDFPSYKEIIPKEFSTSLSIEVDKLLHACKKAKHFINTGSNGMVFNISDDGMTVSVESGIGTIHTNLKAEKSGKDLLIAFNENYIFSGLKKFRGNRVKIQFVSDAAPCVITEDDSDYLYLLLPKRIGSKRK